MGSKKAAEKPKAAKQGKSSALDEAQESIYEAWEAPTRERAVALAHKALSIFPYCADAYCILAENLAETHEEAAGHCLDMLRLNPNDNQGIRDVLMPCLIILGRDEDAQELYKEYEEDGSAIWIYSRTLLDFRKTNADSPAADRSLKAALKENISLC